MPWIPPSSAQEPFLVAGTKRFWSVVRIEQVDDDGQVHFVGLADDDPAAVALLARSQ